MWPVKGGGLKRPKNGAHGLWMPPNQNLKTASILDLELPRLKIFCFSPIENTYASFMTEIFTEELQLRIIKDFGFRILCAIFASNQCTARKI